MKKITTIAMSIALLIGVTVVSYRLFQYYDVRAEARQIQVDLLGVYLVDNSNIISITDDIFGPERFTYKIDNRQAAVLRRMCEDAFKSGRQKRLDINGSCLSAYRYDPKRIVHTSIELQDNKMIIIRSRL